MSSHLLERLFEERMKQAAKSTIYPSTAIVLKEGIDDAVSKKLRVESSSLHRLLSFPVGIFQKLSLNFEALAAVGYFWNSHTSRVQCFKCGHVEESIIELQDLSTRQIILRHYECTHPSEDDIPPSSASILLNYEAHRRYSFYQKDWVCTFMDVEELAKSGFYYVGLRDTCKCHFCKLEVSEWEQGDAAKNEHRKWSPNCSFINGRPVGNFKLGEEIQDTSENFFNEIRPFARAENDTSRYRRRTGVDHNRERPPIHPDKENLQVRVNSFENWPTNKTQKPIDLAEAGFFYTGRNDSVLCFHCDGGLKDWAEMDEPWVLHAKWFGCCRYVKLKMGRSFITSVQRVHRPIMPIKDFKDALKIK